MHLVHQQTFAVFKAARNFDQCCRCEKEFRDAFINSTLIHLKKKNEDDFLFQHVVITAVHKLLQILERENDNDRIVGMRLLFNEIIITITVAMLSSEKSVCYYVYMETLIIAKAAKNIIQQNEMIFSINFSHLIQCYR